MNSPNPMPGSRRCARAVGFILFPVFLTAQAAAQPPAKPEATPGISRYYGKQRVAELVKDIDAIISDRNFTDATWGISIISCNSGELLYQHEGRKNRQVASNLKLLTTMTALRRLGETYRYTTGIYATGEITPTGELLGDLVVRTGGDPSLSPVFGVEPTEVMRSWARALDSMGIRSIRNVIVDASIFDDVPYAPGWSWDDESYGFNAQISAAALYDNSVEVTVTPGKAPGRPVSIDLYPSTAYVTLKVTATTTRADSASTLDIRRERGGSTITVSGNIALGSDPYVEHISVEKPPLFFATVLREELERSGITVRGSPYDAADYPEQGRYPTAREVAIYRSPPLSDIVATTNKQSLNLATEMLVKKIGREATGSGSTSAGLDVIRRQLSEIGVDVEHIRLFDGSGLSRQNMIAPTDITTMLRWARGAPFYPSFLASLSVAGVDGTLGGRLKGTLAAGNIYAKTGYLNGIRAVSGYARTREGEWLAFSIVTNNYSVPTGVVNTAQDLILMRLASFSRKS